MKNYLSVKDIEDLREIVNRALYYKQNPWADQKLGYQKHLLLLFSNPSLRTRLSTERAGKNLGMQVTTMNLSAGWNLEFEDQVVMNTDKAEHIREAARVVSQYADILAFRSFPSLTDQEADYQDLKMNQLAKHASRPVVNMESAIRHPLQGLTDLITIQEHKPTEKPKVVFSWAPHPKALPHAVGNSFIEFMRAAEMNLTITHPEGMDLHPDIVRDTPVVYDQREALREADFVYVKNWSSFKEYGQPHADAKWIIDSDKMKLTNNGRFMHCLPIRRNVVATDDVLDSNNALIIEQANNRTYAAQSVLATILNHG